MIDVYKRQVLSPKFATKNDAKVQKIIHLLYETFSFVKPSKYLLILVIIPIQVVRQARVKMLASSTIPNFPNTYWETVVKISAPFFAFLVKIEVVIPMYASIA